MKNSIFVLLFLFIGIISCADRGNSKDVQEIIGEETTDSKTSSEVILNSRYDRRYNDILESLFQEELKNDEALKTLFEDMKVMDDQIIDSTNSTKKFLDLNHRYFRAAEDRVLLLHDTILKKEITEFFQREKKKYNTLVGPHLDILKDIDERNLSLEDKRNLLKLFVTLPLIKKYQDEKLPDLEQLKNIKEEIEALISEADGKIKMD